MRARKEQYDKIILDENLFSFIYIYLVIFYLANYTKFNYLIYFRYRTFRVPKVEFYIVSTRSKIN